jgi:hypothetical protein
MGLMRAVAAVVVGAHALIWTPFNRLPRAHAWADIGFTPVAFPAAASSDIRVVGAWSLTSSDPRMGGLSALALDREALAALTDSGVVIRLPRPGPAGRALFRDLPAGPGDPRRKSRRDGEALTRLADGDWLVAFENRNQLWRYDPAFRTGRRVVRFNQGWSTNRGAEAMVVDGDGRVLVFPEGRGELFVVGDRAEARPLSTDGWTVSDATRLPDGRVFVLLRKIGLGGFRNAIGELKRVGAGWRVAVRAVLPIGGLDNAEGLAAEPLRSGGTRLWIVTDNDSVDYRPTLLLALDLPAPRQAG